MQIDAPLDAACDTILTHDALALVARLQRAFNGRRKQLLQARAARQRRIDAGERPDFLSETASIRAGEWTIGPLPKPLARRRTEITGLVDAKMIINAFNSGADSYMADFEDSTSPKWDKLIFGQHEPDSGLPGISHLAALRSDGLSARRSGAAQAAGRGLHRTTWVPSSTTRLLGIL